MIARDRCGREAPFRRRLWDVDDPGAGVCLIHTPRDRCGRDRCGREAPFRRRLWDVDDPGAGVSLLVCEFWEDLKWGKCVFA
ncbi:hypothetical protein F2P81_008308 [Scophthalmus maximus]|uniref:Uncharacterized protein n=1 Tax=Scophthalmus maximus TaxID=52904 RepID=A0A6A4T1Y1_SCOMX|nr:hypothetical protein F2P81_008308 [Scophthalmus maximus]